MWNHGIKKQVPVGARVKNKTFLTWRIIPELCFVMARSATHIEGRI